MEEIDLSADRYRKLEAFYKGWMERLKEPKVSKTVRKEVLDELKREFARLDILSMPAAYDSTAKLVTEVLEQAVFYSVLMGDVKYFEFFFALLRLYYFDFASLMPESHYKYEILSLHLIYLLDGHKFAEFHSQLELLPPSELSNNVFLKYAILMEQYLMEGNYNKIYMSRDNAPSPFVRFFVDRLIGSVRNEIASCVESSFSSLVLKDAMKILHCDTTEQLADIAEEREWRAVGNGFLFDRNRLDMLPKENLVDRKALALRFIQYAAELEAII